MAKWRSSALTLSVLLGAAGCIDVPVRHDGADGDGVTPDAADDARTEPGDAGRDAADGPTDGPPIDRPRPDRGLPDGDAPDLGPPDDPDPDIGPPPDGAVDLPLLTLYVDEDRIDGRTHRRPPTEVGGQDTFEVRLVNPSGVRLVIREGPALEGRRGVGFRATPMDEFVIEPMSELAFPLTFDPIAPGPVEAEVSFHAATGFVTSARLSGVGYAPVHAAVGPTGAVGVTPDLAMHWWLDALDAPPLAGALDVACGGTCRAPGDPAGASDAACVLVATTADGAVARYTRDGDRWDDVVFDGDPGGLIAVDHGPPWIALGRDGRLWRSDDGARWAAVSDARRDVQPLDVAVNAAGDVVWLGSDGLVVHVPAGGPIGVIPTDDDVELLRVADAGRQFLAVGERGRTLRIDGPAQTGSGRLAAMPLVREVGHGPFPRARQWVAATDTGLHTSPDGVDWVFDLNTDAVHAFALGDRGLVGGQVQADQETVVALPVDGVALEPRVPPAAFSRFAAGRLCARADREPVAPVRIEAP